MFRPTGVKSFSLNLRSSHGRLFDRPAVLRAVDRAERKALSRAGAFIRRRARSSLRRRKRVSSPGSPPSVHSTDSVATLKNILFVYEPQTHGVVIGPVGLNQVNKIETPLGGFAVQGTVPELLEFGLTAHVFEWDLRGDGNWTRADRRRTRRFREWSQRGILRERTRVRVAKYAARPFMGPALEAELDQIPSAFVGTVTS